MKLCCCKEALIPGRKIVVSNKYDGFSGLGRIRSENCFRPDIMPIQVKGAPRVLV